MKIEKFEKYIFLVITIINLIPVLSGKFFPTMDGPAHLYNSNLIDNLISGSSFRLKLFYIFNSELVPNWTGHIILSIFNLFLPAFIAEKILLISYLIGLPYAFRWLIKVSNCSDIFFSYLIFPFIYSFVFVLGFYNFSIALVFMLIALGYWLKHERDIASSIRKILMLFLIIMITYFSHIFVFGITLLIIGLHIVWKVIVEIVNNKNVKANLRLGFKKALTVFLASVVPLILFTLYFYSRSSLRNNVHLEYRELIDGLLNIKSIISYRAEEEAVYTRAIFYCIVILLFTGLYTRINSLRNSFLHFSKSRLINTLKESINVSDTWLISAGAILILYFTLPNSNGLSGFVSVRLGLMFFIFLLIWIASQKVSRWLVIISVSIILFCNFRLNNIYSTVIDKLNVTAEECYCVSKYIISNSTVLPINYSNHWLAVHFSNYLGADKSMIILDNYECGAGYFPLKWNHDSLPNTLLGSISGQQLPCKTWEYNPENHDEAIDYVFVLKDGKQLADSCNQTLQIAISENYSLIYNSTICQLYKELNTVNHDN